MKVPEFIEKLIRVAATNGVRDIPLDIRDDGVILLTSDNFVAFSSTDIHNPGIYVDAKIDGTQYAFLFAEGTGTKRTVNVRYPSDEDADQISVDFSIQTYSVAVTEKITKILEVQAASPEEAIEKAEEVANEEDITKSYDDFSRSSKIV